MSPEKGEIHPGETLAKRLRLLGDEESHRKVREHGRRGRHSKHERRVRDDGPASRSLWNRQEDTDGSVLKVLLGSLQPAELDAAGNEKDDIDHDKAVSMSKVTAFNDVLRLTQKISKLSQCPVQTRINLISSFQKTDLIINRQLELITFSLLLIKNIITLFFTNSIKWFTECLNSDTHLYMY